MSACKFLVGTQGTILLCDTRLYYEDKERWGDPEEFRPERFIGENGYFEYLFQKFIYVFKIQCS